MCPLALKPAREGAIRTQSENANEKKRAKRMLKGARRRKTRDTHHDLRSATHTANEPVGHHGLCPLAFSDRLGTGLEGGRAACDTHRARNEWERRERARRARGREREEGKETVRRKAGGGRRGTHHDLRGATHTADEPVGHHGLCPLALADLLGPVLSVLLLCLRLGLVATSPLRHTPYV